MTSKSVFDWNVRNVYIVPLLNIGRDRLNKQGFVNSYLYSGDEEEDYDHAIHLLFQTKNMESFNDFIAEERERPISLLDERDYQDGYVLLTYGIPEKFREDMDKFWRGQYSKMSQEFKEAIPYYIEKMNGQKTNEMTVQHMVFTKSIKLRAHWEKQFNVIMDKDQELWALPTIERETFKLSNYVKSFTAIA